MDLTPRNFIYLSYSVGEISHPQGITSLDTADQAATVIDSLTLEQYHDICYWELSRRRTVAISTDITVNLGVVLACSSDQFQDSVEIVSLPDVKINCNDWYGAAGEAIDNGWTRYLIWFSGG
jgi:hypothetical protein